jgi:hypothetical protein
MKTFNDVSELVRFGEISDSCKNDVSYLVYDDKGNCLLTGIESLSRAEKLASGLKQQHLIIIEKATSIHRVCRTIEKI